MGQADHAGARVTGAVRAAAAAVLVAAMAVVGGPVVPAGAEAADTAAPRAAERGSVETIVGPGVCPGAGRIDPASNAVGALVVDAEGTTFVDSGPAELGLVTAVDASGQPATLRTGSPGSAGRLASDGSGGLLVASSTHIDQHQPGGGISTLAGDRLADPAGSTGDAGPAGDARFTQVRALTSDEDANVYVADQLDDNQDAVRIRLINRGDEAVTVYPDTPAEVTIQPGHIDTIAGGQARRGDGDGGLALAANLSGEPPVLAVTAGRLYVAYYDDRGEPATAGVRMINLAGQEVLAHGVRVPAGAIQTVAGGGPAGFGGDGGPARRASIGRMPGIAVDAPGNLYLADADHHRVRKVDTAGVISTFAGSGSTARGGFNGNDRPATAARLDEPVDVAVGPEGHVYFADRGNGQVRVVNEQGAVHAAPGNGAQQGWMCEDDQGRPLSAVDSRPVEAAAVDLATDDDGTLYFPVATNYGRNTLPVIYRREPSGRVAPVLGSLHSDPGCPDDPGCLVGTAEALRDVPLARPVAVTTVHDGLYVLDADGGRLWLANVGAGPLRAHGVTVSPGTGAVVAADSMRQGAGGGLLAADGRGNVFIADFRQVRRLDDQGELTTVVDGFDVEELDPRHPPNECCAMPAGLAVDAHANLYVSDGFSSRVWYLNLSPEAVTVHGHTVGPGDKAVVAGSGKRGFGGDGGPAVDAELHEPGALTVDARGSLHTIDAGEHTIRQVDRDGVITTVVGDGNPAFNGDGLAAGVTTLNTPTAVATDECGNLLIADVYNQRVRRWNVHGPCTSLVAADQDASAATRSRPSLLVALAGLGVLIGAAGIVVGLRLRGRLRRRDGWSGAAPRAPDFFSKPSA